MTPSEVKQHVARILTESLAAKGFRPAELTDDTLLLGGPLPIDSLDLAALVVNLTETTGKDPFSDGFIEFRTLGELARLYGE